MTIKTGDPNTSHLLFDVESEIKGLGTDPFVLSGIVQKFCTSIYPSGGLWHGLGSERSTRHILLVELMEPDPGSASCHVWFLNAVSWAQLQTTNERLQTVPQTNSTLEVIIVVTLHSGGSLTNDFEVCRRPLPCQSNISTALQIWICRFCRTEDP